MSTQPMIEEILNDFRVRYPDKQIGVKAQIYVDIIEFITNALDLAYTLGTQDALEKVLIHVKEDFDFASQNRQMASAKAYSYIQASLASLNEQEK